MRVLWLLHELELPHELVVHDFGAELHQDAYRRLHPAGRVPVLEMDGQVLFESGAILELLCETHQDRGLWRAPGDAERAPWLQWLHFGETIGQHLAALTQQHIAIWEDKDRSPLVMKLEARRLARTLAVVEAGLAGRTFLLETGFSAADISVGYALYVARHFIDMEALPATAAYFARLMSRPAFQRALPPKDAPLIYSEPFYAVPGT